MYASAATNSPILRLTPEQGQQLAQQRQAISLDSLSLQEIARLGHEVETGLQQTLDRFLAQIDRFDNTKLFNLFDALRKGVDQEDLPALADRILNGPTSLWHRVLGTLSKPALQRALGQAWDETRRLASGKTRTLSDKVRQLETELAQEQQRLMQEIQTLEQLKLAYRSQFEAFVLAAALLQSLVTEAQQQLQAAEQAQSVTDSVDPQHLFMLEERRHKLQALQSRALAVEGTLSRLPSDQLVIRQLQNAGMATWQETNTTASARFASIKMTLLTLHGALMTQGVQRLADQGRALDDQLNTVRSQLMRDVVSTSAHLPGHNRLAQAQQLRAIVSESQALQTIVLQARQANSNKFAEARQLLTQAQHDMLALGQQLRPDLAPRQSL